MTSTKSRKSKGKKPKSITRDSGLVFPVGRFHRAMKEGHFAPRINIDAASLVFASIHNDIK